MILCFIILLFLIFLFLVEYYFQLLFYMTLKFLLIALQNSDKLVINFNFTIREITPPDNSPYTAYFHRPLVLVAKSKGMPDNPLMTVNHKGLSLIDYISDGKEMNSSNTLTIWHKK